MAERREKDRDGRMIMGNAGISIIADSRSHVQREAAEKYDFEIVTVKPALHAGGACSVAAYAKAKDPVMVEHVVAKAGMDIGDTFIGMHIKPVAVPVRLSVKSVGEAHLTAVRRRPKSIGGERAVYNPDLK